MDQWRKLLTSLNLRQRILIGAAAVLVIAGITALNRWNRERDFKPLFTGVAAEDAGSIIQKLKESGVEYRLVEGAGTNILVPSAKLAELRLQLAGAGLPKTGRIGFELFDRTNLGSTDFAEHINYSRALEGELERSVRSISEVEQARVHITFPKDSVFVESRLPAKASVLLRIKPGAKISQANVLAICHLMASAVEGLTPEAVSVLDMSGNLLSRPRRTGSSHYQSEEALEYRQKLEREMVSKIHSTLEPLLGGDKFRASVAIECDMTSGEESQETYDPEQTVMLNTQRTEETVNSASSAGVPGTASNMPRPASRPGVSGSGTARKTESVTYAPSKTVRHTRIPQGNIKKISVALLIDHTVKWEQKGSTMNRTLIPPAPEALKTIRDVTAATIGLNTERGDQLVVESLPFESTLSSEPPVLEGAGPQKAPTSPMVFGIPLDPKDPRFLMMAGGAAVLLLLVLLLMFLLLRRRRQQKSRVEAEVAVKQVEGAPGAEGSEAEIDAAEQMRKQLANQAEQKRQMLSEAQNMLKLEPVQTQKGEVLAGYLQESVKADPSAAASVIRTWLQED